MRALSVLVLFIVCALSHTADAQPLAPYGPVQPDRTPLAASQEVPFAFLLGLDGPTALFVNPARAARAKNRFVYGTLDQETFGEARPVSFSALFGSRDSRWLITAENLAGIRKDDAVHVFDERVVQPGFVRSEETTLRQEAEDINAGARGRILLIGQARLGGYAFGLFGGFRQLSSQRLVQQDRLLVQEREQPFLETQNTESTAVTRLEDRLTVYGVGAEIALAGRTWDLDATVSYQGGSDRDEGISSEERRDVSESGGGFERAFSLEREDDSRVDSSPQGVGFDAIGTLRTGMSRSDYLFASVSGTFLSGTGTYGRDGFVRTVERVLQDGVESENRSSDEFGNSGETDLASRVMRFSLGYVYAREGRRTRILAGVLPTAALDRIEAVDGGPAPFAPSFERLTFDVTRLGVDLPLHVHLPVKRSLALFGGGVYTYEYLRNEQSTEPLLLGEATPEGVERELERSLTSTTFSSRNRLYGGAVLSLRSGLTAQAAFRGDLASFDRWTVSLGYRF